MKQNRNNFTGLIWLHGKNRKIETTEIGFYQGRRVTDVEGKILFSLEAGNGIHFQELFPETIAELRFDWFLQ